MSKYAPIDILKLFAGTELGFEDDYKVVPEESTAIHNSFRHHKALKSHEKWNQWLTTCYENNDLPQLIDVRYRLQVGMDRAVKQRLMTQDIAEMCVRWISSIDKTARRIIKKRFPIPKDGGLKALAIKRQRDEEFEKYLNKTSY